MVRIAIVDDDSRDIELSSAFIARYFSNSGQLFRLSTFTDGLFFMNDYKPVYDIVFMDIDMPLSNGMDVARKLRLKDASVILVFMTNLAQYAAEGYDVDAVGFLVKPIDYFSFELKMRKALHILESRKDVHFLMNLNSGEGISRKLISAGDICYLEVLDHNVTVHTEKERYVIWSSLKECADRLKDAHFSFISRYTLVNLKYVERIESDHLIVHGERLSLSRSKRKAFLQELTAFYGGI